jgi:predicted oxidoreductase
MFTKEVLLTKTKNDLADMIIKSYKKKNAYQKKYKAADPEKFKQRQNVTIKCDCCNKSIKKFNMPKHQLSKDHQIAKMKKELEQIKIPSLDVECQSLPKLLEEPLGALEL